MNRSKYAGNKLMRRLLTSKKKFKLSRNDTNLNSRDIIISIFTQETEADKLEYTRTKWRHNIGDNKHQLLDKSKKTIYQPLRYLFPLLQYLSKGIDVDISGFLFVDELNIHIVFNENSLKIVTNRFSGAKMKYWLSHIYFSRMRNKLADDLVKNSKAVTREIVHSLEEKEYMPSVLRGGFKNSSPLVRKIKVSPDNRFRKQGELQKRPFCIIYNKSGTEQQLSFSQILSFLDYEFNINEMIYIKILGNQVKEFSPIQINYNKLGESYSDLEVMNKYRFIYYRTAGWQEIVNQMQQRKIQLMNKKEYRCYCRLITLQIVAFIEVRQFQVTKSLETQWVFDEFKGMVLSNVHRFEIIQSKIGNTFDGLATLYQKVVKQKTPQPSGRSSKLQCSARYKRFKSQEQERVNIGNFLLPLQTIQKGKIMGQSRLENRSDQLLRSKGKSCLLRGPAALFS